MSHVFDNMGRVALTTIEDMFQIEGCGVVIAPDFPVPSGGWKELSSKVGIATPDGGELDVLARFQMEHICISDPKVRMERGGWWIVCILPDVRKEQIPVGSKLMVSAELRDRLL